MRGPTGPLIRVCGRPGFEPAEGDQTPKAVIIEETPVRRPLVHENPEWKLVFAERVAISPAEQGLTAGDVI